MSEKLERCPFCGGEAVLEHGTEYAPWFEVDCPNCDAEGPTRPTEAEAIEAWNRRVATDTNDGSKERTAKVDFVHCIDCAYWMDNCVYLNDGRIRKYVDGEKFVGSNEGINVGSKCLYDEKHGVNLGGYAIFRQSYDYCSKSERRPFEYDAWFGIKDGIYARRWKTDEDD